MLLLVLAEVKAETVTRQPHSACEVWIRLAFFWAFSWASLMRLPTGEITRTPSRGRR